MAGTWAHDGGDLRGPPAAQPRRTTLFGGPGCFPLALRSWSRHNSLMRPARIPTSSPASRRRSAALRFGRWRHTRRRPSTWRPARRRRRSATRASPIASGPISGRRTRLRGHGSYSRVHCVRWVTKIRRPGACCRPQHLCPAGCGAGSPGDRHAAGTIPPCRSHRA